MHYRPSVGTDYVNFWLMIAIMYIFEDLRTYWTGNMHGKPCINIKTNLLKVQSIPSKVIVFDNISRIFLLNPNYSGFNFALPLVALLTKSYQKDT